jgi:hypothetical protein
MYWSSQTLSLSIQSQLATSNCHFKSGVFPTLNTVSCSYSWFSLPLPLYLSPILLSFSHHPYIILPIPYSLIILPSHSSPISTIPSLTHSQSILYSSIFLYITLFSSLQLLYAFNQYNSFPILFSLSPHSMISNCYQCLPMLSLMFTSLIRLTLTSVYKIPMQNSSYPLNLYFLTMLLILLTLIDRIKMLILKGHWPFNQILEV